MLAEIITIGDEILIGQTVDTNSAWMGRELNKRGIAVKYITTISDTPEDIRAALDVASYRADLVLMTGGLGPTQDDVTKATLCSYFNTTLEHNEEVHARIASFFERIGRPMMEVHGLQAQLPKSATVLMNARGTASGMWFDKDDTVFISMPGVPYEMKGIMTDEVFDRLPSRFALPTRAQHTIMTGGVGESTLAKKIEKVETDLRTAGLGLAYLPSPGSVKLRISKSGNDEAKIREEVAFWSRKVETLVKEHIYGYDDASMVQVLGELLKTKGDTLSVAESCTGGFISHELTSLSGSSVYFMGSIVSYDNQVKMDDLGVLESDLIAHGAVSQPVVEQMAVGVRNRYKTTYAISTSGIAGPTGGSEKKPVGTVWVGIATPSRVYSRKFLFGHNRQRNIEMTTLYAFNMLRKEILSEALATTEK